MSRPSTAFARAGSEMEAQRPTQAIEIFLQPGDYYFGDRETRIRTVLGSCISLVFWHPRHRIGGMCHYMLPHRSNRPFAELDGRYADEATALMFREMRGATTDPAEYQVKLFGGANMFPEHGGGHAEHVGARNIEAARDIIRAHGLGAVCEHVGGVGHRSVVFDVWSGNVWIKHQAPLRPEPAERSAPRFAPQPQCTV